MPRFRHSDSSAVRVAAEEAALLPASHQALRAIGDAFNLPDEAAAQIAEMLSSELKAQADRHQEDGRSAFIAMCAEWQNRVRDDDRLGGARLSETIKAIYRMRDMFVSELDRPELDEFLMITGAGDHPAFIRFLCNVATFVDQTRGAGDRRPRFRNPKNGGVWDGSYAAAISKEPYQ